MKSVAVAFLTMNCAAAQTAGNPFEKPPADADDALRARVSQFYQMQQDGKLRAAEALVSEDSKDDYYNMAKQHIFAFHISDIRYSENYTKAKVTIVAKMEYQFAGMPKPEVTDIPFPSLWKIDGGKWCWESRKDSRPVATAEQIAAMPTIESVQQAVKADKKRVTLHPGGEAARVTITNGLPGPATILPQRTDYPGLEVKIDNTDLRGGEKTLVTISASLAAAPGQIGLRLVVQPVNAVVTVEVTIEK